MCGCSMSIGQYYMISINYTPILGAPVPYMLDVTPADVRDELDAVNAACLKWINFHTSMKTFFGQTREVDFWTRNLALRDNVLLAQPFEET